MRKPKLIHLRKLIIQDNLNPPIPQEGDELFEIGIFCLNVERILKYVKDHSEEIPLVSIDISAWHSDNKPNKLIDEYVELEDLSRPVILAEIAPDKINVYLSIHPSDWGSRGFDLIDGYHRIEKPVG